MADDTSTISTPSLTFSGTTQTDSTESAPREELPPRNDWAYYDTFGAAAARRKRYRDHMRFGRYWPTGPQTAALLTWDLESQ